MVLQYEQEGRLLHRRSEAAKAQFKAEAEATAAREDRAARVSDIKREGHAAAQSMLHACADSRILTLQTRRRARTSTANRIFELQQIMCQQSFLHTNVNLLRAHETCTR